MTQGQQQSSSTFSSPNDILSKLKWLVINNLPNKNNFRRSSVLNDKPTYASNVIHFQQWYFLALDIQDLSYIKNQLKYMCVNNLAKI